MNTDYISKVVEGRTFWLRVLSLSLLLGLTVSDNVFSAPRRVMQYGRFNESNVLSLVSSKNVYLSKDDMRNLIELMESLNCTGKETICRKICLALVANRNVNAAVYTELARSYYAVLGDFSNDDTAIKYLQLALKCDPQFSQAYSCLAEIAVNTGDFRKALVYAEKGISCPNPYPDCHLQKSYALVGLKRPHEALAALELAEKTQPDRAEVFRTRGSLLESLHKYDEAIANFRKAHSIDNKDWTEFQIAHCLEEKGCIEEAVKEVSKIIASNPRDAEAYRFRARLSETQKKYKEAIRDLSITIELEPTSKTCLDRARLYEAIGRKDLAAKDKKTAEAMIARPID